MFGKIAVALDGSECAKRAFEIAIELAKVERAEVGICSVVDPILIVGTTPPSPAVDIVIRDAEGEARKLVSDAVDRVRAQSLAAVGETRSGVAAYEILDFAKQFGADLIVMGTHGRTGFGHLLMGSVAEIVLKKAPVPVMVVREPQAVPSAQE